MTFSKDFLVAVQNFEISANFGKNFRLAANYVRLNILSVFELEPFFYVKSKFHIHFWDGVLDYMAEIQFRSFLPIASIDCHFWPILTKILSFLIASRLLKVTIRLFSIMRQIWNTRDVET